mmetsp:Transcript_32327/g.64033  ORF Transcript_32327/g.64033 Transcript_32327/m.64033 type:complete len:684 (+) Transcript_32327:173-2224(+)|eukprot:CAMPEP_0194318640 /NCGR_PEP_ID=MMETSP0171-20130528/15222_1 /TAXON_ID=218684 /ORGANISM="Corethron pennatum, Strain L29A3" /LENGTH=683 /DNA_ID=CAMNT_0039075613 /DNA_START=165 /DNA_END=2216 /DNA_ORIENTATION=+
MPFPRRIAPLLPLVALLLPLPALARPAVRNIKSVHEFDALVKKHATETGLPVIVDFYSDGCGPCRQIAPAFKRMAEGDVGRAVYVKVDMNRQHELSNRYNVRSMPTFVFLVGGKKVNMFSGAGEQQLRQFATDAIIKSEAANVMIRTEELVRYYKEVDPEKEEKSVVEIAEKCASLTKGNKSKMCVGAAAGQLARKLKKKYSSAPELEKRFLPQEKTEDAETSSGSAGAKKGGKADKPNLQLATLEQLQEELEKRLDEIREKEEEEAEDDESEFAHSWTKGDFPERITIVGGGPAGLAAALYAARAGLAPLIVAPPIGGQLQGKGVDVENYPGVAADTGPGLVAKMREQAANAGALFEADTVTSIEEGRKGILRITTETGTVVETHAVVVATGADSRWLEVPGEYEMRGGGVSSCATCDGAAFFDKDVVVVGGGDTAMEEALVLARTSKSVTVVHRRDSFRASSVLAQRVLEHDKISVRWNATLTEIIGEDAPPDEDAAPVTDADAAPQKIVTGVVLTDVASGKHSKLPVAAVFVAIGHVPHTKFLEGVVAFQETHAGYVQTVGVSTATSRAGIFAAGDVSDPTYRQAVTSAGSGAAAALDAERWLSENGLGNEAAEFEAELLREMMEDMPDDGDGYNAYEDGGSDVAKGRKESSAADVPAAEEEAPEAKGPVDEEDDENIEL